MHVNHLILGTDGPAVLIDSEFVIFIMENLRSTRGGLWLMTHPSGVTPVTFGLKREKESGAEAARRLEPRDWRYHWYAGQFWMAEAQNRGDRTAAAYAERALVAAQGANSREVRPLYDRIRIHRYLGKLLDAPATPETLMAWANHAVELSPADPAVRAERDSLVKELTLVNGGRRK